jgi:membrane protein implicated in regulation of membrane protease activity
MLDTPILGDQWTIRMFLVVIAWMFVVLTMSAAEAISSQGTLLGAFFTFVLYGALPLSIVLYVMGAPGRRRRRKAAEEQPPRSPDEPG